MSGADVQRAGTGDGFGILVAEPGIRLREYF